MLTKNHDEVQTHLDRLHAKMATEGHRDEQEARGGRRAHQQHRGQHEECERAGFGEIEERERAVGECGLGSKQASRTMS